HTSQKVRGKHDRARLRKVPVHLLGNTLHTGAAGNKMVQSAAFRTRFRLWLVVAAVVADELAAKPVLDQPARTVGALEAVPADAAKRERRISAAVEEKECLFSAFDRASHGLDQHGGQEAAALRRRL